MCSLKVNLLAAKYPIKKVDCAINNQLKSKFTTGKQFLTSWRGLTTEDINANVGGAIIADKLAYIFHLTPEQQNLSKLKSTIEQIIKVLNNLLPFTLKLKTNILIPHFI